MEFDAAQITDEDLLDAEEKARRRARVGPTFPRVAEGSARTDDLAEGACLQRSVPLPATSDVGARSDTSAIEGRQRPSTRLIRKVRNRLVYQTYKRFYRVLPHAARPSADGAKRVVIYHNVDDSPSPFVDRLDITMSLTDFEAHLRFLTQTYRVVPFSRMFDEPEDIGALAITFDDGYRSLVERVLPIVERLSCPIKIYLNGPVLDGGLTWLNKLSYLLARLDDAAARELYSLVTLDMSVIAERRVKPFVDGFSRKVVDAIEQAYGKLQVSSNTRVYLDRDDVRYLAAHPLVELGSHTRNHFPPNRLSDSELYEEIVGFHTRLVREFGPAIDGFCVPFGGREHLTESVVRTIAQVDSHVVTAYGGRANGGQVHGFPEMRRGGVWGNVGMLWHQLIHW